MERLRTRRRWGMAAGRIVASFLVAAFALGASWNFKVEADAGIERSGGVMRKEGAS